MSSTNLFRSPSRTTAESSRSEESSGAAQHEYISPRIMRDDSFGLAEEMPPAYTPSADVYHGESTVEVGPRIPFQQPPRPSHRPSYSTPISLSESTSSSSQPQPRPRPQSQPQQRPQQPPWIPTPSSSSDSWSTYPGQRYQRRKGGLVGALFDTVREAVDAVSSANDQMRVLPQAQTSAYPVPYSQPSSSALAQNHNAPFYQSSQGQAPTASSAQHLPQSQIADDGSPTNIPAPGHPFLNHGNILVYPNKDYFCTKCRNTGYKNYDPLYPCRKCWEKYGRPFAGPLTYTPWSVESASSASRFQRPLPRFAPPQAPQLSAESSYSTGRLPYSSPPGALAHYGEHLYVCNPIIGMGEYPPVPHAVPVSPGNPRLGGSLCLKCGGTGTLPLLIIDVRPCSVCGGIGRILR